MKHADTVDPNETPRTDALYETLAKTITGKFTYEKAAQVASELWKHAKRLERELNEANAKLREATEWKPIETAPKDGTVFIAFQPVSEELRVIAAAYFDEGAFRMVQYHAGNEEFPIHPTHWMPLPESPKGTSV